MEKNKSEMTPKEKAEELVDRFIQTNGNAFFAKECALICCDEVLGYMGADRGTEFWIEVREELEKL